ncbi:glycosyltransferase family 2 protein [Acinetobacter nosocomialis]|uniref:glycosyltransferase family 2 protein n=1 Tax=Acinetobacter nosocomialis TaxID=106654 RepID=UPI0026EE1FC4|nr:glycosyltransferase [Acinetobacter nosocomialis]MDO7220282.1 glycosyltransferase [Acinetobacter nosocomialis]
MLLNKQPLVSIVIPCYNHANFVQDCIQSVIAQTYQNIELIIIDDGSKDGSVEKIQEFIGECEKRFVRFEFRNRPNKGLSATLNEALEWCQGEYYSVIASDDMMLRDKLELQIDFFKNSADTSIIGVFGGYNLINNSNSIIKRVLMKEKKYLFNEIFLHNFDLPAPTALLKLEHIRAVGGYKEDLKIEDWYMWLKLTENNHCLVYLNKVLVNYRYHESNFSKNFKLMNIERKKVIDNFAYHKLYKYADLKIQWLKATDYLYIDKKEALSLFCKLFFKSPNQIFSKNFLRFMFHFMKTSIGNK